MAALCSAALDRLWQHAEEAQRAEGGTAGEDLPAALVDQLLMCGLAQWLLGSSSPLPKQHGVLFIKDSSFSFPSAESGDGP